MQQQVSLSEPAARVLAHIRARTLQCRWTFANQLWYMPDAEWTAALDEIRNAGYAIYWTHGTIADDPTVTGGWRLDDAAAQQSVETGPRGLPRPGGPSRGPTAVATAQPTTRSRVLEQSATRLEMPPAASGIDL